MYGRIGGQAGRLVAEVGLRKTKAALSVACSAKLLTTSALQIDVCVFLPWRPRVRRTTTKTAWNNIRVWCDYEIADSVAVHCGVFYIPRGTGGPCEIHHVWTNLVYYDRLIVQAVSDQLFLYSPKYRLFSAALPVSL